MLILLSHISLIEVNITESQIRFVRWTKTPCSDQTKLLVDGEERKSA